MKKLLFIVLISCFSIPTQAQISEASKNVKTMKLNAGIITEKIKESKEFYTNVLGFGVAFENEFYLLMHTPNGEAQISFLLPNHSSQQPLFHAAYQGQGMFYTIEVEDVDALYKSVKSKGIDINVGLRDEPWGDRHFAIQDPNGIGIDLVTYTAPEADKND